MGYHRFSAEVIGRNSEGVEVIVHEVSGRTLADLVGRLEERYGDVRRLRDGTHVAVDPATGETYAVRHRRDY